MAGLGLFTLILILVTPSLRRPPTDPLSRVQTLDRLLAQARPGSSQAHSLGRKLRRAQGGRAEPGQDEPEEFVRILTEMKTPADRSLPEYPPGYARKELAKARAAKRAFATAAVLPWVSRGPGNVAGRARAIVVDPDDASHQTWYIGTAGGGVWKTTTGGSSWQWLTPDFPALSAQSLAMAASDHDVLYAGTGESYYNIDTINGNGILKSTDRGATWTHLLSTADNPAFNNVARILVDPADPDLVIAATTTGRYKESIHPRSSIFKSTNGGDSWTEVHAVTVIGSGGRVKKIQQLVADPTDFNVLYATVDEAGILKSTNRGDSWSFINSGITDLSGRFELAVSPVDHNRLYASAEGASRSELWISTNAGTSWSRTTASGSEPNWLGAQGWYDNAIVCHPTDVNVLYVGGIYLWKLTLSGTVRTATFLNAGVHVDHHGLAIITAPGGWRILNTSDGGVAVSTLTDTGWNQVTDGMVTTQFYGIDKRPGASAYVGGTQDNGTWQSGSDPMALSAWTFVIGGDGYETSWHFDDPLKLIGGYQFNGLMRSVDGGQTWNAATTSVSPPGFIDQGGANAPFITKIAKSQSAPELLFAVGRQGVWRSTDFGATWSLSAIPSGTWGSISSFHDVCISRADPNVVWAGSRMDGDGQIQRSTNGGLTFSPVPNYPTVVMGGISGLATHPTLPHTAYVLFSFAERPKILRTTDGGLNWTDLTGFAGGGASTNGFPDVAVYDLQVFSDQPDRLWAATEIGIVESVDNGATWALAENGLPNVAVWFLTEVEDEVVAGTHGRGVWSVSFPSLVAGKTFNPLIEALYQGPDGALHLGVNLRSAYDSTRVWVGSTHFTTLPANSPLEEVTLDIPVLSAGTKEVHLEAYRSGGIHPSVTRSIDVFAPQPPVFAYENDFESPTGDFQGTLFRIGTEAGFTGSAIHSPHPYADDTSPIYVLTVPIQVAQSAAHVEFDEIALVEPGEPGSVYGDPDFYDYVVVEGSQDGLHWTPLADGYDCRAYPEWVTAFPSSPSPSLLRHRIIDLEETFAWRDTILIRFRLFADPAVTGWGWIIDNLSIQVGSPTAVADGTPSARLRLFQNRPNPFRSTTLIRFALPEAGHASLEVFDLQGRRVRTLARGPHAEGEHDVPWDGRDEAGTRVASGTYFYRLRTAATSLHHKLVLIQ